MDNISYYSRCSKDKELQKGAEMIMSALKICIDSFPGIKRVVFKDAADVECDDQKVLLSYLSLLLHGQTWYEKHFKARLGKREKLDKFRQLLLTKPKKGIFSFYDGKINYQSWHEFFANYKNNCIFFIKHLEEFGKVSQIKLFYSEWYIRAKDVSNYTINYSIKNTKTPKQFGGKNRKIQSFTMEDALL